MKQTKKITSRARSKLRSRAKTIGTAERPRISVFRSSKHTYAQVISDETHVTIGAASTLDKEVLAKIKELDPKASTKSITAARAVGLVLGARLKEKKIPAVLFDRNGFIYTGRIKAVADGAREAGLDF